MFTKRDHVKALAKNLLLRLEQDEAIALNPRKKQEAAQALFTQISVFILTDEDIRDKVIDSMGRNAESLSDAAFTESDQYRAAKGVIMSQLGENAVRGIYYQKPVREVATSVSKFVMSHEDVEDVFLDDSELEKKIVEFIKRFDSAQLH